MAAPNYAYIYGTTPAATGGQAALMQGIASTFLGVNTSIAAAISSTGSQAVTPVAMTNIGVGTAMWVNWGSSDQEAVSVTAVTGSTFTANFTKTHSGGATVGVGLNYQCGITNPWSLAVYTIPTNAQAVYMSAPATAAGDMDFIPIVVGHGSATNIYLGSANDIDNSGGASAPSYGANYNGSSIGSYMTIQDQGFSWWIILCEFSIWVVTEVGGTYASMAAGSVMTAQPTNMRGVGVATAGLAHLATSVTVTPDISSRITVGQKILIINQSHNSASTNWAAAPILTTVTSVSSGGTSATIGFAALAHAFDTGALVGSVPIKYAGAYTTAGGYIGTSSNYLNMLLDGSSAGVTSNTTAWDYGGISSAMETNVSPALAPNGLWLGEVQAAMYSTVVGKNGIIGYMYGAQLFTFAGTNQQDVMADPTGAANVWKVFLSAGNAGVGMGPLLNDQNTTTSMTPVASTPWVP